MSKLLMSLTAVVAGVAGTAGAALATEPAPQIAATAVTALAPATVTTKRAVAVVVVRTHPGQTGQSVFTLVGASTQQQADILRLASTPAFRSLRPKYSPTSSRGRYTYRVEAGYQDNTKKRVTVVEGASGTPKVALDLIRMMTNMQTPNVSVNFPPGFPFN